MGHRTIMKKIALFRPRCNIRFCRIGKNTFIGVNTSVGDNLIIGDYNFIGAGCLISKNTEEFKVYKSEMSNESKITSKKFFKLTDGDINE